MRQRNRSMLCVSGDLWNWRVLKVVCEDRSGFSLENPDLVVTGITSSPATPIETDAVTTHRRREEPRVRGLRRDERQVLLRHHARRHRERRGLAAGATATVTASIGAPCRRLATTPIAKVDEGNTVVEQNEANNTFTGPLRAHRCAGARRPT